VLREKLGEDGADALISLINQSQSNNKAEILQFVEEKFERRLSEEIAGVRGELAKEIASVRGELANVRADLIKWMFIFWVGQIGAIIGILFAFFK